ncbi:MAG: sodium:calcium antiporter [Euryarchaeota archaeon]|nr:sodium:calcium antiporter [Euryarchaeota archaeon]
MRLHWPPLAALDGPALGMLDKLWPFPAVISATFLIAWATEVASFFVSRGMALAVLALLQVLPEFAVEAVIAKNAALDPSQLVYVTANFTGANRILVGLALPLVFFLTVMRARKTGGNAREMRLDAENSVEIVFLLIPSLYSLVFFFQHTITLLDTVVLVAIYVTYLWVLRRIPPVGEEEKEHLRGVPKHVMGQSRRFQKTFALTSLFVGGLLLLLAVEPFYHNMLEFAVILGLSAYVLVQWIAPLLSESPEFITATYWSRTGRGKVAFVNLLSAKINQWTLLIAMIPLVFQGTSILAGKGFQLMAFDAHQNVEILLTAAQGLFAVACLMKMRFIWWEGALLFTLWFIQLLDPVLDPYLLGIVPSVLGTGAPVREWVTVIYFGLIGLELALFRREWTAIATFRKVWKNPEKAHEL